MEMDEEMGEYDEDGNYLGPGSGMPKLDRMRKVRREIMRTINEYRAKFGVPEVHIDQFANEAADDYAK